MILHHLLRCEIYSEDINYVLVNGVLVVKDDQLRELTLLPGKPSELLSNEIEDMRE
jgi:hypothetical protein